MDIFLDKYNLPKLSQDQVSSLNRPVSHEEIETVIRNLSTKKKIHGPEGFNAEFFQNFQEESLPKYFYEATVTLIPKPHKDPTKKELQTNLTHEH